RLYRLTPDGALQRETEDHSVVEEEVRAGRMSPEQAANHPSRNVISRALGAEQSVEVDMKTIEVEDGTIFLLCSDGITRHLPDDEISSILRGGGGSLDAACEEMKRLCYERGAEDNLTAVVVRVGGQGRDTAAKPAAADEDERTLLTERTTAMAGRSANSNQAHDTVPSTTLFQTPPASAASNSLPDTHAAPRAANSKLRIDTQEAATSGASPQPQPTAARVREEQRSPTGRASRWFGVLLLLLTAAAAAFYGGIRYQQNKSASAIAATPNNNSPAAALVTPTQTPSSELSIYDTYARQKAAIDSSPGAEAQRMAGENGGRPLDSTDATFLALYGRALFLSGKYPEAVDALRRANDRIDGQYPPGRNPIRLDTRMTLAAAALRAGNPDAARFASDSFASVIEEPGAGALPEASATMTPLP
ncbi:MAG TPA: hypothetical protein VER76_11820, partial [Pyrinomonadaceae bacterium]|nr:hypothetical protein [Pyrinomonadaceae bacterium]